MRQAKTIKIPPAIWDAFLLLRAPGKPFSDYPSDNAAFVALLLYAVAFPRRHTLTGAISRMCAEDQDVIHAFILRCVTDGKDLGALLSKPADARDLLKLART